MKSILVAALLLAPSLAFGQAVVQQAGPVVPKHVAAWGSNGIIVDGGAAACLVTGCSITGNLTVSGSATVGGAASIGGSETVGGALSVAGGASAGSLNSTPIGNTTPSTGAFTTLGASGLLTASGGIHFAGTSTGVEAGAGMSLNLDSGAANFTSLGATTPGTGAFTTLGANQGATVGNAYPVTMADGQGNNGAVVLNFPDTYGTGGLASWQPTNIGSAMVVAKTGGFTTPGDGGAAEFVWNATDTTGNQDVFIIQPNGWSGPGRWHMVIPPGGVHPEAVGLKCDGTTDDSTAMVNLVNFATGLYGGITISFLPGRTCYFASTLQIVGQTILQGGMAPFSQSHTGLRTPDITLATGATLQLAYFTKMRDMFVERAGLPNPPTTTEQLAAAVFGWNTDGSIGVDAVGDDVAIEDSQIVGFGKCVYSNGYQRLLVQNVHMDCANGLEETKSADTTLLSGIDADNFWAYNLNGQSYAESAAVASQGSGGYTNGNVVTVSGGTCTTQPKITLTVAGGTITATSMNDVGDCAAPPSNPVSVTGGSGNGATFNLTVYDARYRPGIGIYLHDQVDGGNLRDSFTGGYQTGIELSNVWEITATNIGSEPDGGTSDIGFYTQNCVDAKLTNLYFSSGIGTAMNISSKGGNDGGSCNTQSYQGTEISMSNVHLDTPLGTLNQQMLYLGPYSRGEITNLAVAGPGAGAGSSAVIAANVRGWQITSVFPDTGDGTTTPWYTIDPTSAPVTSIIDTPQIVPLNSGATLTAQCNQQILVNDTTAPTITMPATCPLNQDVTVVDAGGNAGSHNITLSMPSGSTLNGASSQVISTAHGTAHARYNGTAAYLVQ